MSRRWHGSNFFDDKKKRFVGLRTANIDNVVADGRSVVVRPEAANRQMAAEAAPMPAPDPVYGGAGDTGTGTATGGGVAPVRPVGPVPPKRFYGVVEVDATRLGRDAGRIAQEVLSHLIGLKDANVTVTIEIQAEVPDGIEHPIVRAVTENCRVLKFRSQGFEER